MAQESLRRASTVRQPNPKHATPASRGYTTFPGTPTGDGGSTLLRPLVHTYVLISTDLLMDTPSYPGSPQANQMDT